MRNRKIGEEFRKFQEFDTPFPKIVEILGIMFFWYKIEKLVKNFIRSKIFKIPGISKILGKISRSIFCQLMFFWYKIEKLTKNFFRWRILKGSKKFDVISKNFENLEVPRIWRQEFSRIFKIPGIWRYFQKFRKFLEKFLSKLFDFISKENTRWKVNCVF